MTKKAGDLAQSTDYIFGLKAKELTCRTLNRCASLSAFVRYRMQVEFCHLERDVERSDMSGFEKEKF